MTAIILLAWLIQAPMPLQCSVGGYLTSSQGRYAMDLYVTEHCKDQVTVQRFERHIRVIYKPMVYEFDIPKDCGINVPFRYYLGSFMAYLGSHDTITVSISALEPV